MLQKYRAALIGPRLATALGLRTARAHPLHQKVVAAIDAAIAVQPIP